MKIRPVINSYFSTDEVIALTGNVLRETDQFKPEQPVTTILDMVNEALLGLKKVRENIAYTTKIEAVVNAGEVRGLAFRAFYFFIKAGTLRQNKYYRSAAEIIMSHLNGMDKSLSCVDNTVEPSELELLFLAMEKVTNELDAIGGRYWLDELKQAEEDFLFQKKENLDGEVENQLFLRIRKAKEETLTGLIALVRMLNSLETFGIEGISELTKRLDGVIEEIEKVARARQNRKISGMQIKGRVN